MEIVTNTLSLIKSRDDTKSCLVVLRKLDEEALKVYNCLEVFDYLNSRTDKDPFKKKSKHIMKRVSEPAKLQKAKYYLDDSSEDSDSKDSSWSVDEDECYPRQRKKHCLDCLCDRAFKNLKHLYKHTCEYKISKGYLCKVCKKILLERSDFLNHRNQHLGTSDFKCVSCKEKFKFRTSYVHHRHTFHPESDLFPCSICDKSFARKKLQMRHEMSHKKYVCSICFQRFGLKMHFDFHIKNKH